MVTVKYQAYEQKQSGYGNSGHGGSSVVCGLDLMLTGLRKWALPCSIPTGGTFYCVFTTSTGLYSGTGSLLALCKA
jgi:hypothetical protein